MLKKFFINEDNTPKYRVFWLIAAIIISVWIGQFLLIKYYWIPNGTDPQQEPAIWAHRGVVGDSFGAINALFSGLALAGVLFTIFLQRAESKAQAEDFNKQLASIQKQTETLAGQLKESEKQTQELKRQIKLSIMPAFIAEIKLNPKEFVLLNVGNGTALNIQIQRVDIPIKPLSEESIKKAGGKENAEKIQQELRKYITFEIVRLLKMDTSIVVNHQNYSINGKKIENADMSEVLSHLTDKRSQGLIVNVEIHFQDIEANLYSQTLQMGKGGCVPGAVKELKKG